MNVAANTAATAPAEANDMRLVLWEYTDSTATHKLLRHHRIARCFAYPCFAASVAMASSMAQGLISGFTTVMAIITCAIAAVALILIVPAILAIPILAEIEEALKRRQVPIPTGRPISRRVPVWAMKMMLWFTAAVLLPGLLRKLFE